MTWQVHRARWKRVIAKVVNDIAGGAEGDGFRSAQGRDVSPARAASHARFRARRDLPPGQQRPRWRRVLARVPHAARAVPAAGDLSGRPCGVRHARRVRRADRAGRRRQRLSGDFHVGPWAATRAAPTQLILLSEIRKLGSFRANWVRSAKASPATLGSYVRNTRMAVRRFVFWDSPVNQHAVRPRLWFRI